MTRTSDPLVVYGPWSDRYDFGPSHPLTPRRFGPGIGLLRALGVSPGLAPEPASDEDLLLCHTARYLAVVRSFGDDPSRPSEAGIGLAGDCPPFADMHESSAAVAGGSLRAMEAILRGDVEHAFHPGGGLHHAMAERASGFCIYDDVALAIARARQAGLRVLYLDFDTHHGDGVQAIHASDPGVLTFSIHESGRYLFPGTGFAHEIGSGPAAGSSINVPLEPYTGEGPWLAAVRSLVPELAASFGADVVVSQHGADSHAWDPLADLRVTTTAMGEAARLVDQVAHRWSGGRWLATGGGGYDIYRVVPRAWALTWSAAAHRDLPDELPPGWRERWTTEADAVGSAPLPTRFTDPPNAGLPLEDGQHLAELRSAEVARIVRRAVVPRLVREAVDRGWWDPFATGPETAIPERTDDGVGSPAILPVVEPGVWARLRLAPRVTSPADPRAAHALIAAAMADGARVSAALDGTCVVGLVVSRWADHEARDDLLAVGVAPAWRRAGIAGRLLEANLEAVRPHDVEHVAEITVAERDWVEPASADDRLRAADALLTAAGYRSTSMDDLALVDRGARRYRRH